MKAVLRKELGQTVVEPTSPAALLSGADVLFTGREFFVGLSQWTNTEGAVAVAATWPEYPCTPVKVRRRSGFLKVFFVKNMSRIKTFFFYQELLFVIFSNLVYCSY